MGTWTGIWTGLGSASCSAWGTSFCVGFWRRSENIAVSVTWSDSETRTRTCRLSCQVTALVAEETESGCGAKSGKLGISSRIGIWTCNACHSVVLATWTMIAEGCGIGSCFAGDLWTESG